MGKKITTIAIFLFVISTNNSFSQTFQSIDSDSLVKEKIAFIENSLQAMHSNVSSWQYSWYTTYSLLAAGQGTNYFFSENLGVKQGMALGVITSSLGLGGMLTKPLKSNKALKILVKLPENTVEERKIKLQMAEELLKKSSVREMERKNWQSHATAGAVNLTAGLITWLGFDKTIKDGLITFGISTIIAELNFLTQPKKSIKTYKAYKQKYNSPDAGFSYLKKQRVNWFLSASPTGFRLNLSF